MIISLTDREIESVLSACIQYIELMGEGEDTHEYTIRIHKEKIPHYQKRRK